MNTLDCMKYRKSHRAFLPDQIKKEELETVLAAGSIAPVSLGDYANYQISVIQSKELLNSIIDSTAQAYQNSEMNTIYNTPTLVIISGKIAPDENRGIYHASASCIAQNMLLAATELELASVYLWSFKKGIRENKEIMHTLSLPENFELLCGVALGYIPEDTKEEKELINIINTNYIL